MLFLNMVCLTAALASSICKTSKMCGSCRGEGSTITANNTNFVHSKHFVVSRGSEASFNRCTFEGEWTPAKMRPEPQSNVFTGFLAEGRLTVLRSSFKYFEVCLVVQKTGAHLEALDNTARDSWNFAMACANANAILKVDSRIRQII
jgi:hypothetical protein